MMHTAIHDARRALAAGVLALSGLLLVGCGENPDTRERIESAREHVAEGAHRAAIIELRNVLQAEPNNATARLLLGRIYLDVGEREAAEKELRRALDLGVPAEEVVVELGRALLQRGDSARVLEDVVVEDDWPAGVRAEAYGLRARAYVSEASEARAHEALARSKRRAKGRCTRYLGRVELALLRERIDDAVRWMQRGVEAYPESPSMWRARMRVALEQGELEAAEQAAGRAIEFAANSTEDRIARARVRARAGQRRGCAQGPCGTRQRPVRSSKGPLHRGPDCVGGGRFRNRLQ
ncbi:MAG: tetratricopeptide repeat protein [Halofilum sp. (in: g-proteobacteria)]|nr:tetratricopeptide repeat protein [Halofilum sp. (in: g-proteobacteria)]